MSNNEVESDSENESDSDNETTEEDENKSSTSSKSVPDDIGTCVMDTVRKINYKQAGFVFILFILITSTTFIDGVLSKRSDCVSGIMPTIKGTLVQGVCLVLGFIAIDVLITNELI
jgi:hypothetical protein